MNTLADVLRLLLGAARSVGGISEADYHAATAIVDDNDEDRKALAAQPSFSDVERAQLEELQARKQAADDAAAAAEAPAVPEPGGGFHQEAGVGG